MSSDKCIIEFMQEKGIICPCITQNYTGPLYPGFLQDLMGRFISLKLINFIHVTHDEELTYFVHASKDLEGDDICIAHNINSYKEGEIILHEIMRIITMR